MERLGQENETLAGQIASLEEKNASFDDMYTELKMEAKELRKQVKENKVVIINDYFSDVDSYCRQNLHT